MSCKSNIPGKDAFLEETIATLTARLRSIGLEVTPNSWLNPAPHCWSVHLVDSSHPYLTSNGKGRNKKAALASGLAEFMERLATNFYFADYFLDELGSSAKYLFFPDEQWFSAHKYRKVQRVGKTLLKPDLWNFYDPHNELSFDLLIDHNCSVHRQAICGLPFHRLGTKDQVYFPVSLLNNLYSSNGMAAGNSRAEATAQALSEILERYVKKQVISQGLQLPDIPATRLGDFPRLTTILETLQQQGFCVRLKDASLGGRFPVVCVLLLDRTNGGAYCAFGANLRFEVALERTLTELLQGRRLSSLHSFSPPVTDLDSVADPFNIESHFIDSDGLLPWRLYSDEVEFAYCPWNFSGNTQQECEQLLQGIHKSGFQVYRAEYCQYGFYTCRLVIPGMSEVYPIDDMLYSNTATTSPLRESLLNLESKTTKELAAIFQQLEELTDNDQLRISSLIHIRFDAASAWYEMSVGELKALLLLAMGNQSEALFWCNWCLANGRLNESRSRFFRLLDALLGLQVREGSYRPYLNSVRHCFSPEEITLATATIAGNIRFPGLVSGSRWRDISPAHEQMLALYASLSNAKAEPDCDNFD